MRLRFSQGENSIAGLGELGEGELIKSVGAYYRPNDPRIWKQNGRALFADTGSGERTAVALCQFDDGADKLLALSNGALYGATPGLSGTFTSLVTGLTIGGDLITAHALDRHYLVDGVNYNRVLDSDGSVRRMGMVAQPVAITAAAEVPAPGESRPTSTISNSGWTNPGNSWDASYNTYAHATLAAPGTAVLVIGGFAGSAAALRRLNIYYRFAGNIETNAQEGGGAAGLGGTGTGVGGDVQGGYTVTIKIEKTENSGSSWTTIKEEIRNAPMPKPGIIQSAVSGNSSLVQLRATLTYSSGVNPALFQLFDVRIMTATSAIAKTSSAAGLRYCLTEWDDVNGRPGPPGQVTPGVVLTAHTQVRLTLPATPANSDATHWRIYRTPDSGSVPDQLGWIGDVPIDDPVFIDDFTVFDFDEQPGPPLPMIAIEFDGEPQYYTRDSPPPRLSFIWHYKGSLLGISPDSPRSLFMGLPSRPESWPEINIISSFPFPEHDQLVAGCTCGDTAIIGARGLMIALDDIPRVTRGVFNASEARPLAGQPGLVSKRAICAFSVAGEDRAAWVSRFGIYETNGTLSRKLTDDIDWQGRVSVADLDSAILSWDPDRQVLIFAFAGTNPTDEDFDPPVDEFGQYVAIDERYALIHMADAKQGGLPKITWGHPGRISSLAAGEVSGVRYIWSGHVADGKVYVENTGGVDDSNSFNADGEWPLDAQTDQIYDPEERAWEVYRGRLYHSDSGTEETCTIECRTGRDSSTTDQVRTKIVQLSRDRGNELFFGLAGQWVQFRVRHTGSSRFALNDLWLDAGVQELVGDMLAP